MSLTVNHLTHEGIAPPLHPDQGAHVQLFIKDQAQTMNREVCQPCLGCAARQIRAHHIDRQIGFKTCSTSPIHVRSIGRRPLIR